MCGIAGIFLKDRQLEPGLGRLLAGMLGTLSDRGPDLAGFAVYGDVTPNHSKLTLRASADFDFEALLSRLGSAVFAHKRRGSHLVITVPEASRKAVVAEIEKNTGIRIVGSGSRMEIFKEVGRPDQVAARFNLDRMSGTHAIGHTRMATESAVTTEGAHPFTTGPDQCLVHNGSLSNHNAVRRELVRHGLRFETDNDSEVAAGFPDMEDAEWRIAATGDGGGVRHTRRVLHLCYWD